MRLGAITLIFTILCSVSEASPPQRIIDSQGRIQKTLTPASGRIVVKDRQGRVVGSFSSASGRVTVRDAQGRIR